MEPQLHLMEKQELEDSPTIEMLSRKAFKNKNNTQIFCKTSSTIIDHILKRVLYLEFIVRRLELIQANCLTFCQSTLFDLFSYENFHCFIKSKLATFSSNGKRKDKKPRRKLRKNQWKDKLPKFGRNLSYLFSNKILSLSLSILRPFLLPSRFSFPTSSTCRCVLQYLSKHLILIL